MLSLVVLSSAKVLFAYEVYSAALDAVLRMPLCFSPKLFRSTKCMSELFWVPADAAAGRLSCVAGTEVP